MYKIGLTKPTLLLLAFIICCTSKGNANNNVMEPKLITMDYTNLVKIRNAIGKHEPGYEVSYQKLLKTADSFLRLAPESVTDGDLPPTKDKHDFYCIGKFSWPNPNTPDSLPYIRGDGKFNQEAFGNRYDLTRFEKTVSRVNLLCLAWFYSQNERYAIKAKELLTVWFLNPATAMNPNMNCASALPGVYNGMKIGIIFTVVMIKMTDHLQLLRLSPSWDEKTDEGLKQWFVQYISWLENSQFGKEEVKARDNHGSWYDAQVAAYSLFVGNKSNGKTLFERAKLRLNEQIAADGSLTRELKRAEAFHYTIYGISGMAILARCLDVMGYNLWNYQTTDGRGILLCYRYISPYILDQKKWDHSGVDETSIRAEILERNSRKNPGGKKAASSERDFLQTVIWANQQYHAPVLTSIISYLKKDFAKERSIEKLYVLVE